MFKNFIIAAIRNTWRNRIYLSINILGLGISIAFGMTVYLIFAYNWEFDSYYRNMENIFHVQELKQNTGPNFTRYDYAPFPLGPQAMQEISGVQNQTRYILAINENVKYQEMVFNVNIAYVDTNFFDFFKIILRTGSYKSLKSNSSIYLTEELAQKYFGENDPLGKIITVYYPSGKSTDLIVSGVFNRIPLNSTFQFGALSSINNGFHGYELNPDDWTDSRQPALFLKLKNSADVPEVSKMINRYLVEQNNARPEWKVNHFELVDFKDSKILNGSVTNSSYGNVRINTAFIIVFSSMAILIFLIACFNQLNTTMALMGNRLKEVGVRKVMGGTSFQIFLQFIFEMSWISFLAVILGFAIFQHISDVFFSLWGMHLILKDLSAIRLSFALAIIFLFITITAGTYPSLYSKKFKPTAIFQNRFKLRRAGTASKLLNALQFTLSIMVLAGGVIFLRNEIFIRSLDLGYKRENIINISTENNTEFNLMRDKIKYNPDIQAWSATNDILGERHKDDNLVLDSGDVEIHSARMSGEYLEMMGLHLLQGRLFNKDLASDYSDAVIVNQAYVDWLNIKSPLGKLVNLREGKRYIIGVIENVIVSIDKGYEIVPELYLPATGDESINLVVKTSGKNNSVVFYDLANTWKKLIPFRPFPGIYQNSMALGNAQLTSRNLKMIFIYLGIIGALLSLTGVFALSALNVSGRIKEIGIRKVMGANSKTILFIMNHQFILLMGISIIVGMILSYFFINGLLSRIYEYHTPVSVTILFLIGFIVFLLAVLTTSSSAYKASITNPSKILRSE